jgi:Ca-activated chloride channel family protein
MRSTLTAVAALLLVAAVTATADPRREEHSPSAALAGAGPRPVSPDQPPAVAEPEGARRTLAPYFHVGGGGETERLPLEETRAEAVIAGPIARVTVHQVFRNGGANPIEAVYVFPASTRAAVHALRMKIGERTVEAHIARRGEARQAYEAAREGGRRAALLEEQRPNVFTMSVANVMPGERIAVELTYSELIVPDDGVYELVYPAVVGPRYGGDADPAADRWIASPYLHEGEPEPWKFGFRAHLESAIPLAEVASPSHALHVRYASRTTADVTLAEAGGGDRDVVLRWRLAGDAVQAGAMLLPGAGPGDPGYFLVAVEPPARPPAGSAAPAREYVFLVDVSGSMYGFPLETAKALMRDLLGRLAPQDYLNVVLFAGASQVLSAAGSLPATPENVKRALALVESQRGGGGTELMEGLRAAYGVPRPERAVSRSVVVVTDGYVGVESQAFRFVRERLSEANLFAFGIGTSVNRHLMEGLARAGEGEPFLVLSSGHAAEAAQRFRDYVERPVLTGVEARFEGLDAREVLPARVPDLFARRPIVLVGQYLGAPRGRVVLTGRAGDRPWRAALDLGPAAAQGDHAPLRALWARRWVQALEDELSLAPAKELEEAVADVGLSHALLTRFTSFVAVDSEVVNRGGQPVEVAQPLPLPRGVSDSAVGGFGLATFASKRASAVQALGSSEAPAAPEAMRLRRADAESPRGGVALKGRAEAPASAQPAPTHLRITRLEAPAFDGTALRAALEPKLAAATDAFGPGARARLRLTVDAQGRVVRVAVLEATSRPLRRRLEALLGGAALGARPAGAAESEVLVEVAG